MQNQKVRQHGLETKQGNKKFIEGKTVCSGFPFFGLENDEFRNEMVNEVASQEMKMVSKLRAAEKTIKDLRTQKQELISTNNSLQCSLTEEQRIFEKSTYNWPNKKRNKYNFSIIWTLKRIWSWSWLHKMLIGIMKFEFWGKNLRVELNFMIDRQNFRIISLTEWWVWREKSRFWRKKNRI